MVMMPGMTVYRTAAAEPANHEDAAATDDCHQIEDSDCCKNKCNCCATQFFPLNTTILATSETHGFQSVRKTGAPPCPDLEELIRPPILV